MNTNKSTKIMLVVLGLSLLPAGSSVLANNRPGDVEPSRQRETVRPALPKERGPEGRRPEDRPERGNRLTPEEQELATLARLLRMPEDRLDQLAEAIEKVRSMSPEEREATLAKVEAMRSEKRAEVQERRQSWQSLPKEERRLLGQVLRDLSPNDRRELRQDLEGLSPEERIEKIRDLARQ
ncbi:MAG: DUF3106 domain-containing protein [Puniceicoccaceae bacterium]